MSKIINCFNEQVRQQPNKWAVVYQNEHITYSDLNEKALKMAELMVNKGIVIIYLPKGIKAIIAILACLIKENTYVIMDTRSPIERCKKILTQTQPCLIISDNENIDKLSFCKTSSFLNVDMMQICACSQFMEKEEAILNNICFILFTSGSTGIPKGVMIQEERILHYITNSIKTFDIKSDYIIGNQAPFYFTVSNLDIYLCLMYGLTLNVISENTLARANLLSQYIEDNKINLCFWVPSVLSTIANSDDKNIFSKLQSLQCLLIVGERMAPKVINKWLNNLPKVNYYYMYGSTEAEMVLCNKLIKCVDEEALIPVGKSIFNASHVILNDCLEEVETGILYIAGSTLTDGYYQDKAKNLESFIDIKGLRYFKTNDLAQYDQNRNILLIGRKDHQFKHLGYRIEGGEIEAAVLTCDNVIRACIVYDEVKEKIVLIYECSEKLDRQVMQHLMGQLPIYMLPTKLIHTKAMPLTNNGKIDRMLIKQQYLRDENGR